MSRLFSVKSDIHPTKVRLIETVATMLETQSADQITSDDVLEKSGVSKGSLYHHFEDFPELIEEALISRFTELVDRSIELITRITTESKNQEEARLGLIRVTELTQSKARANSRFERSRILATAQFNPRMVKKLRTEQERLTSALADLFRDSQAKGWMSDDFDPRAAAVMIQAYTLGKIVDDVTEEPMAEEDWNYLITKLADKVFGLNP